MIDSEIPITPKPIAEIPPCASVSVMDTTSTTTEVTGVTDVPLHHQTPKSRGSMINFTLQACFLFLRCTKDNTFVFLRERSVHLESVTSPKGFCYHVFFHR